MNIDLEALRAALAESDLDGWLLFDFHDLNPLVRKLIGVTGLNSRRLFVLLPREGEPVALAHKIELNGLKNFPGEIRTYARWNELETELTNLVSGKRVAMEVSPEGAVPYLDRVPLGAVQLLERLGATIAPSADLVAQFGTVWSEEDIVSHRRAGEMCKSIAQSAFDFIRDRRAAGVTVRETDVQRLILDAFAGQGLETEESPIVGFGANSADPHYGPVAGADASLIADQVVLVDLWCKERGGAFADQTWMGFSGDPPARVIGAWDAVRRARDAVVEALERRWASGETLSGADLDDVARSVLTDAGFGDAFLHRTGHSIHHELHGIGTHLDNYETRDTRVLLPVCGFSVEPGAYFAGEFGIRSEINVLLLPDGPVVTPAVPQRELFVV